MNSFGQSNFDNLRTTQFKLELQETIIDKIESLLPKDGHVDLNSIDPQESENNSYKDLLRLRRLMRSYMGLNYQDDFIQDLRELTKPANIKLFVEALIKEQLIADGETTESLSHFLDTIEKGSLADLVTFAEDRAKESLFGALKALSPLENEPDGRFYTNQAQRTLYDEIGFQFGRPDSGHKYALNSRIDSIVGILREHFGRGSARGYGIVTGATVGHAVLHNILTAKRSIDISMFQLEHSLILSALYFKRQQFDMLNKGSAYTRRINILLSSPTENFDEYGDFLPAEFDARGNELPRKAGFNWINQAARSLLGPSVKFDPGVEQGDLRYAHQKFLATDLVNWDHLWFGGKLSRRMTKDARILIGSFNMTRGALGNILDRSGNLVQTRPYNFEFALHIGYDLVRYGGLKEESFKKIHSESRDYADFLKQQERSRNQSLKPLNYNPEHLLTGPQTYDRLQRALGLGGTQTDLASKVDAFFMLNVITDRGMQNVRDGRGLYHVIEEKLRSSQDSTVTIFVSEGFKNIRSRDLGPEGPSSALERIRELEHEFGERFKVVEVDQLIHAKSFMIFQGGLKGKSSTVDIISGSANISGSSLGSPESMPVSELALHLSSRHFSDDSLIKNQAQNVLSGLWLHSNSTGKGLNPLKNLGHASSDVIMMELQKRLNPSLSRLITVTPDKSVGSLVSLSIRVKDPNTGRMFEVREAVKIKVQTYNGDPNRIYLPDLQKVVDPVLGQAKNAHVKYGSGNERGTLQVIEFGPSAVMAAALEEIAVELEKSTLNLLSRYGKNLLLTTSGQAFFTRQLRRMGGDITQDVLRHQEGVPVGEYASEARKMQRLMLGLDMRPLEMLNNMPLDAQEAFLLTQMARTYGGAEATHAPILSLREELRPLLSHTSIERSFERFAAIEAELASGKRVKGNAPSHVIRIENGKIKVDPLAFTVLADSLSHDKPTSILLAEAFDYLQATNYDDSAQAVMAVMNPAKLAQWAQRIKNALGGDIGYMKFDAGSQAASSFRQATLPIGSGRDAKPRTGTEFRFMLMWGMNEQTYMQADVLRGAHVGYQGSLTFHVKASETLSGADAPPATFFDGRVKLGADGNWEVRNANGEYVPAEAGKPLLEITHNERHINGMTVISNNRQELLTQRNPIYGQHGARVVINGIVQDTDAHGRKIFRVQAEVLQPVSSSMRMLSQQMKMVFTGLGSFIDKSGKVRSFFTDLVEGINFALDKRGHYQADSALTENVGLDLDTTGNWFKRAFKALGMTSPTGSSGDQLAVEKLHGVVGESLMKSGVALLHTGYTLLEGYYDSGAWAENFLNLFESTKGVQQFEAMLQRIQKEVESKSQVRNTDIKQRFLLQGIESLLEMDGSLENNIKNILHPKNTELRRVVERIRSGDLKVVTTPFEKLVLAAAAAYHVYGSIVHSENIQAYTFETAKRIGGNTSADARMQFGAIVPIVIRDNISVAQFSMSNHHSSIFHLNYVSEHSQTLLSALSKNPEVRKRQQMVTELFAIGYLGGTTAVVANQVSRRAMLGEKEINFDLAQKENIHVAGVHFEPLAYVYSGMGESAKHALLEISNIVREITYGKANGLKTRDLTQAELEAAKKSFMKQIAVIKENFALTSGMPNLQTSPQRNEHMIQSFNLQSKARLGGAVIYVPVLTFAREHNALTHEITEMSYERISLPSPDAVVKLQNFDDHVGEILRLSYEIQRQNLAVRNVLQMAQQFGGVISSEAREQYEAYMANVRVLKQKIKDAATTDVQKTLSALTGVQGFAMIANTFGSFDGVTFREDAQGRKLKVENVIVMGDEVMNAVTEEAMVALKLAKKFVSLTARGRALNVAESKGVPIDKVTAHQLKLNGKTVVIRKGRVLRYTFQELKFSSDESSIYLTENLDTYDGSISEHRGVATVIKTISNAYNLQQKVDSLEKALAITHVKADRARYYYRISVRSPGSKTAFGLEFTKKFKQHVELEEKANKIYGELSYYRGLRNVFALKIQQEALKNQIGRAQQLGINTVQLQSLKLAHGFVAERMEILSYNKEHLETLTNRIKEVKTALQNQTLSAADKRQYSSLLKFMEGQTHRINQGFTYTTQELMSHVGYEDISHAFMAAGISLEKLMTHAVDTKSLLGTDAVLEATSAITKLLSVNALVGALQDAQSVRKAGLAVAGMRAGAPVGNFGPVGYFAMSVRDFNRQMQSINSSFNLDPYMNRRSMFLHISGMALNLGDFDGDNIVLAQIKRYTLLKTIDQMSEGGIRSIEKDMQSSVEALRKKGVSEEVIRETFKHILQSSIDEHRDLSLTEELEKLENELYRRHGNLLIEQTERYLGLHKGGLRNHIINDAEYKDAWREAGESGDTKKQDLYLLRYASKLNIFSREMFGHIETSAQSLIKTYLSKASNTVFMDASDLDRDAFEKFLNSNEGTIFQDGLKSWFKENAESSETAKKYFENILGTKVSVDTILKYGVQVAFASTKLIGNWTNVQTMQQSMNSYSRFETFNDLQNIQNAVLKAAEISGNDEHVEKFRQAVEARQRQNSEMSGEVHQRLSGYMLHLQQATRDAIKEKAALSLRDTSLESVFESMQKDNPLISAIDKTYALIYGKSIFDSDNAYSSDLSTESTLAKVITSLGADQAFNIAYDANEGVRAEISQELMSHEHFGSVAEHLLLPHLEAIAKMNSAFVDSNLTTRLSNMTAAAKMKFFFSEDSPLSQDARTTAILMAHSMWRDYDSYKEINDYKRSLMYAEASDFEKQRQNLDSHLKLIFLNERMKGGKLQGEPVDRLLQDIVKSYVSTDYNLDRLYNDARNIDPTGYFGQSVVSLVGAYIAGQNLDERFQALQRNDIKHYQMLAEMEYLLADAVKANPLVKVQHVLETPTEAADPTANIATNGEKSPADLVSEAGKSTAARRMQQDANEAIKQRAFEQDVAIAREIAEYRKLGTNLGNVVHTGLMAFAPLFSSKHIKYFGVAGGSVFGAGIMEDSASANQLVHGTRDGDDFNMTSMWNNVKEYTMTTLMMWEPQMAIRFMRGTSPTMEQFAAGAGIFGAAMAGGHYLAGKSLNAPRSLNYARANAPIVANLSTMSSGSRAAALASLVGMMTVANNAGDIVESVVRNRHYNEHSELIMHHQIAEDINLAEAIASDFTDNPELLNPEEDPTVKMVQWDGTIIDNPDENLKLSSFDEGLALNDGTSITPERVTGFGVGTGTEVPENLSGTTSDERQNAAWEDALAKRFIRKP